jgi:hypothetical protein
MKKSEKSETLARRDFLKGLGVAGAAGVATATLSGKPAEAALPEDRKTSGLFYLFFNWSTLGDI